MACRLAENTSPSAKKIHGVRINQSLRNHRGTDGAPHFLDIIQPMPRYQYEAAPIELWRKIRWFAIHTKARREVFAAANIGVLGVKILLPQIKEERSMPAATRIAVKPLFPGYLFARFCPEKSMESIECTPGVLHVVSSGRFPVPVDDEFIREMQDRAEEDGFIRIRKRVPKPGDRVSIQDGPFEGLIGRVERWLDGGERVAILLEALLNARVLIESRRLQSEAA
jgi:transcriptional antiterminator RfaH